MVTHCGVTKITTRFYMGQLQVLHKEAGKVLLNLPLRSSSNEALDHLDAIVVFNLIKLAEAMIYYTFLVCVPIGERKLSCFKH